MIFKALILFIALSYVHSSPISTADSIGDKSVSSDKQASLPSVITNLPHELPKILNVDDEAHETRSARVARENKVEYLYVDAEGKMRQVGIPKNAIRINAISNEPEAVELIDKVADVPVRSVEKPIITPKSFHQPSLELNAKPADEKLDSSSLQYASGNLKVRNENLKSRMTNGVPTGQQQQSSPFVQSIYPNDLNILSGFNPLISPLYTPYGPSYSYPFNYPLQSPLYNPLLTPANLLTNNLVQPLARSTVNNLNLSPEELEIRRDLLPYNNLDVIPSFISNLPYLYQNRLLSPNNLFGRTLSSLIYSPSLLHNTPFINPFLPYALPQQTPSLNYLLGRNAPIGLNGLAGYDGYPYSPYNNYLGGYPYPQYSNIYSPYMPSSVYPNLANNLLYPGLAQNYYPSLYPQYLPQTGINYPYYNQPLYNQLQPSILPQSPQSIVAQPQVALNPQEFAGRRVATTTTTTAHLPTTTVVSNSPTSSDVQPFSDSVASNNVPSVVIPGETVETSEKPLLYSNQNQNAALRSPYYDSLYLGSNYNSAYYSRLIDPLTGLPYYRYPTGNGYYSRGPVFSSSIYRPGFIGTYPPGYLNGYGHHGYNGIVPYSSMHYSADPSDLASRSSKSDEKVSSTSKDQSKESSSNLMYSIKTSKSESKETVSRLNQEAPKMNLDDNKKA